MDIITVSRTYLFFLIPLILSCYKNTGSQIQSLINSVLMVLSLMLYLALTTLYCNMGVLLEAAPFFIVNA